MMFGGGHVDKGIRMQVTLAPEVAKKLDEYCQKKGVKRSAVISFALGEFWKKEEYADEK